MLQPIFLIVLFSCVVISCRHVIIEVNIFDGGPLYFRLSITKTRLSPKLPPKTENFKIKNSDIFHISAQNIDYGYALEPPWQDVRVKKTMCGTDCWTDHRLVVSKLNLRIQPARRPQGKKVPKRLDVSKLKQDSKRQAFINDICSRLAAMELRSDDQEENWTVFRDTATLQQWIP